ncbi:unnamed protein product, partial [Effrenium voratum]
MRAARCVGSSCRSFSNLVVVDERIFQFEKKFTGALKDTAWSHTLQLWSELAATGLLPSGACCSAALTTLSRSLRWRQALHLFAGIQGERSRNCCNAAVAALAKGGHWQGALHVVRQMGAEAWPAPDAVSFGAASDACARALRWDVSLLLLKESPSLFSLTSCIAAQDKASQWQHALSLLAWAEDRNLKPSAAVLNAVLGAYGTGAMWAQALELLAQMRQVRRPNRGSRGVREVVYWFKEEDGT